MSFREGMSVWESECTQVREKQSFESSWYCNSPPKQLIFTWSRYSVILASLPSIISEPSLKSGQNLLSSLNTGAKGQPRGWSICLLFGILAEFPARWWGCLHDLRQVIKLLFYHGSLSMKWRLLYFLTTEKCYSINIIEDRSLATVTGPYKQYRFKKKAEKCYEIPKTLIACFFFPPQCSGVSKNMHFETLGKFDSHI